MCKKTFMKGLIAAFLCIFSCPAWAYDFSVENDEGVIIYYNILSRSMINGSVEVTYGDIPYSGEVNIPATVRHTDIRYPVTGIGDWAFQGCSGLTSVTIGSNVTSISKYAFADCSSLTSVTGEENVTSIEECAFYGCSSLTSVTLSSNLTSIETGTFNSCSSLESIDIPDAVTSIGDNAFQGCSGLKSVTIGNSVKSIGSATFHSCSSLESIEIPNSVESISGWAFQYCSSLKTVTLGSSVTSIGYVAFGDCTSLESFTSLNPEPPTCDDTAFFGASTGTCTLYVPIGSLNAYKSSGVWSNFKNIVAHTNVGEKIEVDGIFYNVLSDTELEVTYEGDAPTTSGTAKYTGTITIPATVDTYSVIGIGDDAFSNCQGLGSVVLPDCLTYIGEKAFYRCPYITSINLNSELTSIGASAFEGTNLAGELVIPDKVTTIDERAFYYLYELTSLTLGNSLVTIGGSAFYNCMEIAGELRIPDSVVTIGDQAFNSCSSVETLIVGSSVETIGYRAFNDLGSVKTITSLNTTPPSCGTEVFRYTASRNPTLIVPNGCKELYAAADGWSEFTNIEEMAAVGDKILVDGIYYTVLSSSEVEVTHESSDARAGTSTYVGTVTIPETISYGGTNYNVIGVGYCAFYGCTELTSIVIGNKVTYIGEQSFNGCSGLTEVTLSESVTKIVDYAFMGCSSLASITIGENVTSIGVSAFNGCSSLTEVTIPDGVTELGYWAFWGCSSLKTATLGNGVTVIDNSLFRECSSLETVTFGSSVTSIGYSAFSDCTSLESIVIPNTVTSIGDYAFDSCTSLTSATIGNSVKSIGYAAFGDCTSLESIDIPNSVTSIDGAAFMQCSGLQEVTLGNSVESIGYAAFAYCTSLQSFTSLNPEPPTCDDTAFFGASTSTCILYVPEGSVDAYSSATGWSDFTHILQIGEELAGVGDKIEVDGLFYNILSDTEVEVTWGGRSWSSGTESYTGAIEIPETVTYQGKTYTVTGIGQYAFYTCTGLESIVIPNSVESISGWAFQYCSSLTSVTIGENVKSIGYGAFGHCTSLESIEIPESVESIGEQAFSYSTSLTSIHLPASVTSLGYYVFDHCTSLAEITVAEDNPSYCSVEGVVFTKDMQSLVRYPAGSARTEYVVPEGVTAVLISAFRNTQYLTTLSLPASLTDIGSYAFEDCTALASITTLATTPPTCQGDAFRDVDTASITLIVPDDCVEVYSTAYTWKDFYIVATGINGTNVGAASEVARYSLDGKRLSHPQRGMNIVVYSDGTTRKVNVK